MGLGAPYWDPYARGTILGMTRGTNRAHIVRAALESIVYQTRDVVELMAEDAALPIVEMKVDGGASVNNFICQFLADQTSTRVCRPETFETTALGAAYLAGLAVGLWPTNRLLQITGAVPGIMFQRIGAQTVLYRPWKRAVERSGGYP